MLPSARNRIDRLPTRGERWVGLILSVPGIKPAMKCSNFRRTGALLLAVTFSCALTSCASERETLQPVAVKAQTMQRHPEPVIRNFIAELDEPTIPPLLQRSTECMFAIVQTVPGVSKPSIGIATNDGWKHPYIEYYAVENRTRRVPIVFEATKTVAGGYAFLAIHSGMGAMPDLSVADLVIKAWKVQCGIEASVWLM